MPFYSVLAIHIVLAAAAADTSVLDVRDGRVAIRTANASGPSLVSPPEGLWSIAHEWKDGRPVGWFHGSPAEQKALGEWTVLSGEIATPEGVWRVSDWYRPHAGLIQCVRRFEWHGDKPVEPCTLSVRFQCPGKGRGLVMPGIQYHGNPSGARSGRTPVYEGRPGEAAFYEEHRFPMPFVSLEWNFGGAWSGAALHSLPSPVPFGHLIDQWWSMGVEARDDGTEFALLSGPTASNGQWAVVKGHQPGFVPYDNAYLRVPPGAIIEKTFYAQAYDVPQEGSGFRSAVRAAMDLADWSLPRTLPAFSEVIRAKYRYAKTRWYEQGDAAAFCKYPDKKIFVMGWCGQADALGYALPVLDGYLRDSEATAMAQRSLDFLSTAPFYEGGFRTWYHCDTGVWDHDEPLSQGQAMLSFANAIRVGRAQGRDTAKWEAFLRKACDFHAARILDASWKPVSTDQGFFIAPLCVASKLFANDAYKAAAEKAGKVYAERHLAMREPYWGGTLDASCEDKEGAYAALQGFLALYDLTGKPEYLAWAEHACDVVLTYVVTWNIDLPPGRLRDHAFQTRGWTAVSVQNQHIDVFGVIIAPFVYRLGQLTQRDDLTRLALLMYLSCGQLIDAQGSQGEQPQHTNYTQGSHVKSVEGLRGGYVETWTVFWITAHFLNAAAMFSELGVPLE